MSLPKSAAVPADPRALPGAPRVSQTRFYTQDGPIWPLPRHEMTEDVAILGRMIEDARTLFGDRGADDSINEGDFWRLGWEAWQVTQYGARALAVAKDPLPASPSTPARAQAGRRQNAGAPEAAPSRRTIAPPMRAYRFA